MTQDALDGATFWKCFLEVKGKKQTFKPTVATHCDFSQRNCDVLTKRKCLALQSNWDGYICMQIWSLNSGITAISILFFWHPEVTISGQEVGSGDNAESKDTLWNWLVNHKVATP